MFKEKLLVKDNLIYRLFLTLIVPLSLVALFSLLWLPLSESWKVFAICVFSGCAGAVGMQELLRLWEGGVRSRLSELVSARLASESPPVQAVEESTPEAPAPESVQLTQELCELKDRLRRAEQDRDHFRMKYEAQEKEFNRSQQDVVDASEHKDRLLTEYQQTIHDQREVIKQKQEEVYKLESRVRDLTYEVKTLLKLDGETPSNTEVFHPVLQCLEGEGTDEPLEDEVGSFESQVSSPFDATVVLKRYLSVAEGMNGASHLQQENLLNLSAGDYALDQRRLFDQIRSENNALILVYSAAESKVLFVNALIGQVLGWSADKFVADFDQIVTEGAKDWAAALEKLGEDEEAQTRLLFKSKNDESVLMHASLAKIPSGIFEGYVMAVLYAVDA